MFAFERVLFTDRQRLYLKLINYDDAWFELLLLLLIIRCSVNLVKTPADWWLFLMTVPWYSSSTKVEVKESLKMTRNHDTSSIKTLYTEIQRITEIRFDKFGNKMEICWNLKANLNNGSKSNNKRFTADWWIDRHHIFMIDVHRFDDFQYISLPKLRTNTREKKR